MYSIPRVYIPDSLTVHYSAEDVSSRAPVMMSTQSLTVHIQRTAAKLKKAGQARSRTLEYALTYRDSRKGRQLFEVLEIHTRRLGPARRGHPLTRTAAEHTTPRATPYAGKAHPIAARYVYRGQRLPRGQHECKLREGHVPDRVPPTAEPEAQRDARAHALHATYRAPTRLA